MSQQPAHLAFLSRPAPGVCLLNLQATPQSEHIRVPLSQGQRYGMLVKLAEMTGEPTK